MADNHYYDFSKLSMNASSEHISTAFNEIRRDTVEKCLGIPKNRVRFLPNHMCHLYHAYYSGHLRGSDVLVVDVEGEGEGYNLVVAQPTSRGLEIIAGTSECMLGRLYQWTTLLLGMKPYHHEYKVMGLAPWASEHEVEKSYKVFAPILRLSEEQMVITYDHRPPDLYYYLRDRLQGHRFDGIAGGLQRLVESRLTEWLSLVLQKTGRSKVCYAGGVALNVKANMKLAMLDSVEDFFVPVSPGDESCVLGAGYWITEEHFLKTHRDPASIPQLSHVCWGAEYDRQVILEAINQRNIANRFYVQEHVTKDTVVKLLAQGVIVARYQGRSEFGQRALGNRSILANPSLEEMVDKINHQIKYRDFWMPFAPTILEDCQHEYLENPHNIRAPYMTIAFPVRSDRKNEIIAAVHVADLSARPQILSRTANPEYYDLIQDFRTLTGIGAVLNTSFNLHGEPIVDSPQDALHTFTNSELDTLWMDDILISRSPVSSLVSPEALNKGSSGV